LGEVGDADKYNPLVVAHECVKGEAPNAFGRKTPYEATTYRQVHTRTRLAHAEKAEEHRLHELVS